MLDVRLPFHLGVEADALYERFGYTAYFGSCCAWGVTRERANSWQFPVIVKLRGSHSRLYPYIGAGYAPRVVHGTDVGSGYYLYGIIADPPSDVYTYYFNRSSKTNYSLTHGAVVAGGVELGFGHLRVSPELRYIHWNQPFLNFVRGDGAASYHSEQDELLFMVGIAWDRKPVMK